ncbi:MAG: helix-turn-helix domain-containing protein [Allorhizobium sp.]
MLNSNAMTINSDDCDDTLGGRLSTARDSAGIEMNALANQLGVKRETMQAWESDRSAPRPSRLVNLAGILGVSPMWLMTGNGQGPSDSAEGQPLDALRSQIVKLSDMHQESGRLLSELTRQVERYESDQAAKT